MKYLPKIVFTLLLSYFTYVLFTMKPYPWIFLDNVNLLIHEAGHLILSIFGNEFLTIPAGSFLQLTIPLIFFIYFLIRKEFFGIAFCTFWLGDNFINVGIYMSDAISKNLPLIKEGLIHDWEYIFRAIDQLQNAEKIGSLTMSFGYILLIGSLFLSLISLFVTNDKKL